MVSRYRGTGARISHPRRRSRRRLVEISRRLRRCRYSLHSSLLSRYLRSLHQHRWPHRCTQGRSCRSQGLHDCASRNVRGRMSVGAPIRERHIRIKGASSDQRRERLVSEIVADAWTLPVGSLVAGFRRRASDHCENQKRQNSEHGGNEEHAHCASVLPCPVSTVAHGKFSQWHFSGRT